jgi:hypothetical protein
MPRLSAALLAFLAAGASLLAEDPPVEPKKEYKLLGPRFGKDREAANKKYNGTDKTEAAVVAGLDWLARHAEPGGGWTADGFNGQCAGEKCPGIGGGHHGEKVPHPYNDAITGFVTLAFLGHGHRADPEGDAYAKLVDRALQTLTRPHSAWGLALATEALAEAEAMEGQGRWSDAVKSNVERLMEMRLKDGGWAYAGDFRGGGDVPFTAFVVQALVAAQDAGVPLPEKLGAEVDAFLNGLEVNPKNGRLAYLKTGRQFGYTPTRANAHSGAAIRELLQAGTNGTNHKMHLGCVAGEKPEWKIEWKEIKGQKFQVGNLDVYMWYYGTIASFHAGGGQWTGYFGAVKGALLPKQNVKDGCLKGSWNNEGTYDFDVGGRVFTTALCTLMLEQPYRHRRLGK